MGASMDTTVLPLPPRAGRREMVAVGPHAVPRPIRRHPSM